MCDFGAIAGLIMSGASAAANASAASKVAKARQQAYAAERIRQQALDQEAQALNTKSQDRYQNFEGQQTERARSLADFYGSQNEQPAGPNGGGAAPTMAPQASSNITVQEEAKQRGQVAQFSHQQADALGNLRAFGDLLGGIGREQAREANKVGQIGNFKQGSANVLEMELEAANSAGNGARMLGDVLGGLGRVVGAVGSQPQINLGGGTSSLSRALPASSLSLPTFAQPNNLYRVF